MCKIYLKHSRKSFNIMKSIDALKILPNDRVSELFLQGNSSEISRFCRGLLMQAKFYHLKPEDVGNLLRQEIIWQEAVYKSYDDYLCHSSIAPSQKIEMDSETI